jgi:hypothetical protein
MCFKKKPICEIVVIIRILSEERSDRMDVQNFYDTLFKLFAEQEQIKIQYEVKKIEIEQIVDISA